MFSKITELKNHKYGTVESDQDENKPKSTQKRVAASLLACGMALLLLGGAIALAVVFSRARNANRTPVIPAGTGSHQLDVASDCDTAVEGFVPPNLCVSCFHMSTPPKVQPKNCPAGTYYDEEYTCSCVPCLKHNCCPGGDTMEECPTGSFQPKTGQATCELAIVFGDTIQYKYKESSALTVLATPGAITRPKIYDSNKCNGAGDLSDGIAVISGMTSNDFDVDPKLSIEVRAQSAGLKESKVLVSKLAGSRIQGYAAGVIYTCLRQNFVTTLGYVSAKKITAGNPKTAILRPNLQCKDSSPQIFAALSGIESKNLNNGGKFSLSIQSSVRSNENDLVRPKVKFLTMTQVENATAAVFAFCSSPTAILSEGIIETGSLSASSLAGPINKEILVKFRTPKKCVPTVALGLTGLNSVSKGALAVNLELLGETVTSTSFKVKIAVMTDTKVESIEGAFLATCGMLHSKQTKDAVKKVCFVPTL